LVLGIAVHAAEVRRLAWLGIALTVPGILNYALMLVHALNHVFWSMQGFAGLCALASIAPYVGLRWLRQCFVPVRIAGAALLVATSATVLC
jgi:hypothetical protein